MPETRDAVLRIRRRQRARKLPSTVITRTRPDLELRAPLAVAQLARRAQAGPHHRALEKAPLPGEVDLEAAARAKARDTAVRPRARERRQQVQLARVALQQHLRDPGAAAEVAVDLERRVVVEEVGQGRLGEQRRQVLVGLLPVAEPREEVHHPGAAPARAAAAVRQPALERDARGPRQLGRAPERDRVSRVQAEEVGDVTVARLGFVEILEPLLQLAVLADPVRRQPVERALQTPAERRVLAEDLAGAQAVAKQLPDDPKVHRRAHAEHALVAFRVDERVLGRV